MSNYTRKTFDDTYGRHALVIEGINVDPSFGRVDVISLLEQNHASSLHPSRVSSEYQPTHARKW
jgi:hypothetical protein